MKTKNTPDKSTKATAEVVEPVLVEDETATVVEDATPAASTSTGKSGGEWALERSASHHYSDMAKIAAGMLVGVLALMTFLLSVGLQHPKPMLRSFLYVSFVSLGLSLLFYQIGTFYEARTQVKVATPARQRQLGVVRVLQHLIFTIALVATIGFAITASQLFFVTATTQTQTQG